MPNTKLIISVVVFSLLLFCTSVIKNKTRIIEKNIESYEKQIFTLKKELFESQLDFNYLTSPKMLQKKLSFLTYTNQINNGNIFIAPATPIKKKVISILFFL